MLASAVFALGDRCGTEEAVKADQVADVGVVATWAGLGDRPAAR